MRPHILSRMYKIIRLFLVIFVYKITIHQCISSYAYSSLKQIWYEWSKFFNINEVDNICLLQNPFSNKVTLNTTSCYSCETIREISEVYQTSFNEIELLCIYENRPVLITDVMSHWPKFDRMDGYNLNDMITVFKDPFLQNIEPCYYTTSFRQFSNKLADYWKIISNPQADNWFLTWKNCNLEAAKYFRYLYYQPYFTKYFLPASQVNWIVISSHYESVSYNKLLVESSKLLVLIQLKGTLTYRLQPHRDCRKVCHNVTGILKESQTLVLNSDLWEIHYWLRKDGINLSVMLEYDSWK